MVNRLRFSTVVSTPLGLHCEVKHSFTMPPFPLVMLVISNTMENFTIYPLRMMWGLSIIPDPIPGTMYSCWESLERRFIFKKEKERAKITIKLKSSHRGTKLGELVLCPPWSPSFQHMYFTPSLTITFIPQSTQSGNGRFLAYTFHHDGKSALAGEDGGARPSSFTLSTIMYKVAVYTPAERADTLTLFHVYHYRYSVVHTL